jgi:SAM-dependent methyltransferase
VVENLSVSDAVSAIAAALEPISGKRILDIGCGSGPMARPLSARGAIWAGVDPYARPGESTVDITLGAAEKLPFTDNSFDSAIFVNSLHHVPLGMMEAALSEAARVVEGGPIVVIEPRVDGALSDVLRIIDDETKVRTAAQQALHRSIDAGQFASAQVSDYLRIERFADFDAFLQKMVSNNPLRRDAARANRQSLQAAFVALAERNATGATLNQPMRLHILHLTGQGT